MSYFYGGKLDNLDSSDEFYSLDENGGKPCATQVVDLSIYIGSKIYDQAPLKSCTANAVCAAYALYLTTTRGAKYSEVDPSRLFLHYNSRADHSKDSGVNVREAITAFKDHGVCKEDLWPYKAREVNTQPPQVQVEGDVVSKKRLINDLAHFKACLDDNCPFIFSFNTYGSLEQVNEDNHHIIPMPNFSEAKKAHTVMAVGYDDKKGLIKVLNSWGNMFGKGGYFYIPYHFMDNPMFFGANGGFFWRIEFTDTRNSH